MKKIRLLILALLILATPSAATWHSSFGTQAGTVPLSWLDDNFAYLNALNTYLNIGTGKYFTVSNTLTLTGTDGATLNIGSGGTLGSAAFTNSTAYQTPITDPITGTGERYYIPIYTAAGTIGKLSSLGTAGYVLTSNGPGYAPTWQAGGGGGGGSMTYPDAGVAVSNGVSWDTSLTVGASANNLVKLDASARLPAVSAALLTNFPTLNQSTSGTAAGISGTQTANYVYAAPNGSAGTASFRALVADDIPALANYQPILVNPLVLGGSYTPTGVWTSMALTTPTITTTLTMADAANFVFNTATGTKIGTGTTQKLAFYGSTAIVKPSGNLLTAISNLGLVTSPTIASGDLPATIAANTSGTAANLSGTPALPNGTTATTQSAGDNSSKIATTAYVNAAAANIADRSITGAKLLQPTTAGSQIYLGYATTARSTTAGSYTKLKQFTALQRGGNVTVGFFLISASGSSRVYGKIYKNGVAAGSEHYNDSTTPLACTDNITVSIGDVISVYGKSDAGETCQIGLASITAQDPYAAQEAGGY